MRHRCIPVSKGLKNTLMQYGECVPNNCYLNPVTGNLWKMCPGGQLLKVTKDPKRVLAALEYYVVTVEATRKHCRANRNEWFSKEPAIRR